MVIKLVFILHYQLSSVSFRANFVHNLCFSKLCCNPVLFILLAYDNE